MDDKCSLCHMKTPCFNQNEIGMTGPDIHLVVDKIRTKFSQNGKNFDQEAASQFVIDYVFYPHHTKALLDSIDDMPYGLMPSIKGSVTQEELKYISDFLFEELSEKD